MKTMLIVMFALPALVAMAGVDDPAGDWTGNIQLPGTEMYVEVQLTSGDSWTGRISIPMQGAQSLPLEAVSVAGDSVSFRIQNIPGLPTFRGVLAGPDLQGTFTQSGMSFPFALQRPAMEAALPAGLRERDVTLGSEPYLLPGIVTAPEGKGPWPVLILVHGSGPNDRDESIGPSRPFRDLAWGLAQEGIAVVRYDKRTFVYKGNAAPDPSQLTVNDEVVQDVVRIVEAAGTFPEADAKRIFVLGHSLGGMLIPRIAHAAPQAAGFVVLAGPTRPLEDLILEQNRRQGAPPEHLSRIEAVVAAIKALDGEHLPTEPLFFAPASYWLDLRGYRPAEIAAGLHKPMLILQGDKDCQVTLDDFALWTAALEKRAHVQLKRYPNLNHLFMPVEGISDGREYTQPGQQVSNVVIQDIASWVLGTSR